MTGEQDGRRVWRKINGKHTGTVAATAVFGYWAWVSPGEIIQPLMPWIWPAVLALIAVMSYSILNMVLWTGSKTAGGESDGQ